jgi:glycosyltransferase involved in cell wall biosynthesis
VDRLVRFIYRHCDGVLVPSKAFIPHVEAQGTSPHRVHYFPNWAEGVYAPVDLPPDAPERRELPGGFRILFAGNIGVSQSFPTILHAAELTRTQPEIQWVVVGDGREKAWVEREVQARGLGQTVRLLGKRPTEAMPRYFAAADALLVTLKRDPVFVKTVPGKVQSYLACGRPILAALDGEGARLITEAGAGLTCPAEDGEALASLALALHACSPAERAGMGRNGLRYCEANFHRDLLLGRLETLMREAMEGRRCVAWSLAAAACSDTSSSAAGGTVTRSA